MSLNKCVVRLKDSHDTEHSVVVYAESLYEAALRGLNRLADVGWESDGETIRQVEVEIHQEPTTHIVNVPKLLNCLAVINGLVLGTVTVRSKEQNLAHRVLLCADHHGLSARTYP
jgi:hypothetical protein